MITLLIVQILNISELEFCGILQNNLALSYLVWLKHLDFQGTLVIILHLGNEETRWKCFYYFETSLPDLL